MTGAVQIGTESVKFCGNAATAIRYKQVFRKDLLMSFKGMSADDFDADLIKELAFIMMLQASGADFKAVSYDEYIEWLEKYEETDVLQKAPEIIGLWMSNTQTLAKAKKK